MTSIHEHLRILDLQEIPDLPTLKKRYLHRLKECHPDLNRDREEWAHQMTRRLIEASRVLQEYIKKSPPSPAAQASGFRRENPTRSNDRSYGSTATTPEDIREGELLVQFLRTDEGDYALPLHPVIRIVSSRDTPLRTIGRVAHSLFEGRAYPLYTLRGETIATLSGALQMIILYSSPNLRCGFVVEPETEFEAAEAVSPREILRHPEWEGGSLLRSRRSYTIPGAVLSDFGPLP